MAAQSQWARSFAKDARPALFCVHKENSMVEPDNGAARG